MDTTARAQDFSPPSISTIGEDLTITGNVTSKGELHLNGQIQGDVHCYVEGNPFHKSFSLEQGTQFEGELRVPSDDPLSIPEIHEFTDGITPGVRLCPGSSV